MAESESQPAGQRSTEEAHMGQPTGAVQMKDLAKKEQIKDELTAGAPAGDKSEADEGTQSQLETAAAALTNQPSKGKEREVLAAPEEEGAPAIGPTETSRGVVLAPTVEPEDDLVIGPTETSASTSANPPDSVSCNITLLLPSGARHPYKIDERYLTKRNVDVPDKTEEGRKDPFSISVYTLKELVLREWREEWENKPSSPSSIRLIHFGKMLDDKNNLKTYNFSAETPNVVHMTVRPAEMMEDDEGAKGKSSGGEGPSHDSSRRCCVIL